MDKVKTGKQWEQLTKEIRKVWGKLTDEEVATLKHNVHLFYGILEEKYGLARAEAERRVHELEKKCGVSDSGSRASAA